LLDGSESVEGCLLAFGNLRRALSVVLQETQPDCVVATYPAYGQVIQSLYHDHAERPFRLITVVTDSISVNSSWYRAASDWFCVANEDTAGILRANHVPAERIKTFGFPVSPLFASEPRLALEAPTGTSPRRILYIINTGKKKTGKAIDRILDVPYTI